MENRPKGDNTDFFSSLSKLISEFLKLIDNKNKQIILDKNDCKNKCIAIYEKVFELNTNKENEIELKSNSLTFLKRIIDDEFKNPN